MTTATVVLKPCGHPDAEPACNSCWNFDERLAFHLKWGGSNATFRPTGRPRPRAAGVPPVRWAVGVTTVGDASREWERIGHLGSGRREAGLLGRTLKSLARAGFPRPHLFVDGAKEGFNCAGVPVTYRWPAVLTWANWYLSLQELIARNPEADRYLMAQDDFVCAANLRAYLDACEYPTRGYWNLFTFPENRTDGRGWAEAPHTGRDGDVVLQQGLGAVALAFNREAAMAIVSSPHAARKMLDPRPEYRHKKADGGVVTAMNYAGYREYVHQPSLVQHTGLTSSMGNGQWGEADTFPGEDFDCLLLLCPAGGRAA